jgi:hypothetical protein
MAKLPRHSGGASRDLLAEHGRWVAIPLVVVAAVLVVASFRTGVRTDLPGIALDWKLGLVLVRAALAFAVVAFVVMFLVRGWGGMWPRRISTSGVDFDELAEGSRDVTEAAEEMLEVLRELVRLETEEKANG